jgi:hypothetical protein
MTNGLVIVKEFPVTLSEGPHPFPSRTRKLSPLEPIILPSQGGGKVGSRRILYF